MKRQKQTRVIIFISCLLSISGTLLAQKYPFQNPNLSIEERVNNIVSLMTLDEKISCLSTDPSIPRLDIKGSRLRQRGEDIILLFNHFLEYFSNDIGIAMPTVDPKAQEILMNYKWPGNVRELRNVVQRLVLNNTGHIGVKEVSNPMVLKNSILSKDTSFDELNIGQVLTLREMEKAFRLRYFKYVRSISSSDTNAAEKLGIAPSNFYRMCKELGLK